ncbi:SusC/RagA family TonB-linked outer membrane protein [Pontibacter harenae]|uniref:SusC/RagA family TonB-linked outer membrane protein n=1 Tax=Pontibacter harenae TaxID=2894083 RepID=UPI001E42E6C5|nr:TonB-dependent receptor [Pontibacter harenae]MCC9165813.1 TonB-dependent receptor [Pontibacter harenae]
MKKILEKILCLPLLAVLLLSGVVANAQTTPLIVRGKVTEQGSKEPLVGVSVTEMDEDNRVVTGAQTDLEGNFAVKMKDPSHKLVISYMGFKTVTVNPNNRSEINVQLESSAKALGEVEIVAEEVNTGMMAIDKRNLTSAIATVSAKEIQEVQATSIDQALQGRMAGVDIVANTGDPGAGMSIRIRGTSSINSNADPLIVVDGMPYAIEIASDFNFATADEQGYAQLLNIAPADIKEISVLKDAAATALWGSRASNGVLVITTKRGSKGKPTINYTFKGTVTKQPDPIPMLSGDQYSMLIPEAYMNRTGMPLNTTTIKEFLYDPNDPYYYYNYSNNTDWIDAITQTGLINDHNISLSGGGDKARYYTSVGYLGQKGTTIGTDLSRISTRINLDFNVSERIRFRTDLAYTHSVNNRNYTNSIRSVAYNKMPNMGLYEVDEYGNVTPNYFSPATNIQGGASLRSDGRVLGTFNPLAMALEGQNRLIGERIIPKFNLQYDIIPDKLMASSDVQFDINNSKTKMFLPQTATGRPWTETSVNRASDSDLDQFSVVSKTNLLYTPRLSPDHNLQAIASFMTFDYKTVGFGVTTSNAASALLQDPSVPSRIQNEELTLNSSSVQNRSVGVLLNAQYSYLDRYIINGSIRRDGSSKFGENHRWGTFPSVSARWRVSGEPFMQGLTMVDDLSARVSYGTSGNEPSASYGHFNIYNNFDWNYLGMSGVYPANMELKNLKWETVVQQNVGFNLQMFQYRLGVDVDFYKKRTKDMFYRGLDISSVSGFSNVDMNVGVMDNQGWEIAFNTTPYQANDLTINFALNLAKNNNIIREISDLYPRTSGDLLRNGSYLITIQENNPFGSFYGYRYKGVYPDSESIIAKDKDGNAIVGPNGQVIPMRFGYPTIDYVFQPGDAMYEDINHDGNIDHMDVVYLGNANPKLTGGFGPSLSYKNWKVNLFFNFRYKFDVVNQTKMLTENMYGYDNQSTAVLRRWRNPGDETDIPRALLGYGYNWLASDRYVEDASFLRFKYITIRYNLPAHILQSLGVQDLGFYVTAENLLTFTNYTGQDPEVTLRGSDPLRIGFDESRTPPVQNITVGANVRF